MPRRSTVKVTIRPDGRLSRKDAALYLGLAGKTLAERKRKGLSPRDIMVGGRSFYDVRELDRFIANGHPILRCYIRQTCCEVWSKKEYLTLA